LIFDDGLSKSHIFLAPAGSISNVKSHKESASVGAFFLFKEIVLHDRKSVNDDKRFTWDKFSKYLLQFTDVIIRDDYIFNNKYEIETKFKKIINALGKASKRKYHLLIILNKDKLDAEFNKDIKNVYRYLEDEELFNPEKVNVGLVHTSKEHDRFIFFNYLEVDFGKIPDSPTKPTKITFNPYTRNNYFMDAQIILRDLKEIVSNADNKDFAEIRSNKLLN
jgi:hypothetical protein